MENKKGEIFGSWNNHKQMALSLTIAALLICIIGIANLMIDVDDITMNVAIASTGPSMSHYFGVDWLGRDMFLRTMKGLGGSLNVGLLASAITLVIATFLAIISASTTEKADQAVGFLIDTMMGVPHLVLLVLISASLGGGKFGIIVAVAITHWPSLTRVLRAEILRLREETFIEASRKLGKSDWYIAKKHMFWHLLPQILVRFVLVFPHVILHEAGVTFLGFGLSPLEPAIGIILSESVQYIATGMWWLVVFPGVALLVMVMCFESIGDNLNKMLNPDTAHH